MKKLFLLAAVALMMATSCNNQNNKTAQVTPEPEPVVEQTSGIYDITVKDMDGSDVSLANYKGKVLLIVNVASKCGLTPQYEGLEALYQKYKDQGLEILAFPCNQFLEQEPGTNEEIQSFCSLNYNVTFPLFDKIDVNGEAESPLYTYLKKQAPFKGYPEARRCHPLELRQVPGLQRRQDHPPLRAYGDARHDGGSHTKDAGRQIRRKPF